MFIGLTKIFCSCFTEAVRENGFLGELIIKSLLNLKHESYQRGLNVECLSTSVFKSARVTRDYRIIFYQERDVGYLLFLGRHGEAYDWAEKHKTIHYKDYFVGYWDSSDYDDLPDDDFDDEEYSGFDKRFQSRLQACTNGEELLKVCEGLAPEYIEKVISHNAVNNILDKYSSEILVIEDDEELIDALERPFEEWMAFLHPNQKAIIEYPKNKNLCICGGPGTGKTVSLVHRLVSFLKSGEKCLLISKSETTIDVVKKMVSQLDDELTINEFFMDDINEDNIQSLFRTYDYFFIDELQDIGKYECQVLIDSFKKSDKHFTMAYDLNQAVYTTKNKKKIYEFSELASDTIILDYNYRCTSEIFLAAAEFIKYQYDRLKTDTFDMRFAMAGNEVELYESNDSEIDLEIEEHVFDRKLLTSEDWAVIFAGYYNPDRYESLTRMFPDNVFNVPECKGMDFKSGCVVIYNIDFNLEQNTGFKEFNAQSYVAITRFRDSVSIFLVNKKYEDTPQKAITNIHNNALISKKQDRKKDNNRHRKAKEGKRAKDMKLNLKIKDNKDV